ncbi:MAG: CHAT domain-containing protein [Ardenticatenaceae bacterium]
MNPTQFVTQLLALPELADQEQVLNSNRALLADAAFADEIVNLLRAEVRQLVRQNISRCLEVVELMFLFATMSDHPLHRALALYTAGSVQFIGQGKYQEALDLLEEAFQIYDAHDMPIDKANVIILKMGVLANLGRYEESLAVAEWARDVFTKHAEWQKLTGLNINLATIYMRLGKDKETLNLLDKTVTIFRKNGTGNHRYLSWIQQNRATSLRHLGRFQDAIHASQAAITTLSKMEQDAEVMRARQNLALTYFVLGRYNESLQILEEVREFFLKDDRQRDAIMVELFISDGLLYLRRFREAIETCQHVRERFTQRGLTTEVALALLNLARAHAGLGQDTRLKPKEREAQFANALDALTEARKIFEAQGNQKALMLISVERALVLYHQGHVQESLTTAERSIDFFQQNSRLLEEAKARLVAAQAAIQLADQRTAAVHLQAARLIADQANLPVIRYQCDELRGDLFQQQKKLSDALAAYEEAIKRVELLKGRMMVEFRVDFAAHHQTIYQKAVAVCLEQEQFAQALDYAERAKSRALLDLLAQRLDLSIQAKQESDLPLVEELRGLRSERDRLYRRLESAEDIRRSDLVPVDPEQLKIYQKVAQYEEEITKLWQRLMIRNADYARDAALWQVHTEPMAQTLPADTLLLEYFIVQEQLIVFLVTSDGVQVQPLPAKVGQISRLAEFFKMNRQRAVPNISNTRLIEALRRQGEGLLQKLYNCLVAPFAEQLASYKRLIIVPHDFLHHLPFHALHDGHSFLIETHEIAYLPNSTLHRYCQPAPAQPTRFVSLGYSNEQKLPYAVSEAQQMAQIMKGKAYVEQEATLTRLRQEAPHAQILHLATHGDFNENNPLFCGLNMAGGEQLATIDLFSLRLSASLVTLSACQSGRNVIGGGDELLGLMRGFLAAGAASLLLTHWPVEDQSTSILMELFYQQLAQGVPKATALRHAQLQFIRPEQASHKKIRPAYKHPYFWAPFFLVGHTGAL